MAKRGTFAFELSKPSKRGMLMKQGSLHKAFKYRYFVLYPGFLVYYESENKWKMDLAKGETLGNRIGAIKLKNGTVSVARDAPKGCKFGLIVHAPDPVNKRQSYLLNAVNKGDRDDWITAVRGAIPHSPKPAKKEFSTEEKTQRPQKVIRQDTATAAALLDSERDEEEKETSIDSHLPTSLNNANLQNSLNEQEEEENEEATSFNDELISKALGSRENGRNDSSDEETQQNHDDVIPNGHGSPVTNGDTTSDQSEPQEAKEDQSNGTTSEPQETKEDQSNGTTSEPQETKEDQSNGTTSEPQETKEDQSNGTTSEPQDTKEDQSNGRQLESEKKVESSMNIEGKVEVVTSVKVQTSGSDQEEDEEEKEGERRGEGERGGDITRKISTEVAIAEVKTALTVTLIRDNTGDVPASDTESDDDSTEDELSAPPCLDPQSTEPTEGEPTNCSDPPPDTSSEPSTPATPCITIDKVPTLKRSEVVDSDTMCKEEEEEAARALQAKGERTRRTSAPFIEKRGFLYKEGGQRKTWKLRYFVLQPGMFTYYKTPTSTKPLGEVKLKNLQIRYPSAGERKQSFQFIVHTESAWNKRNDYVIAAQTNTEMKEWITAFKLAGQKNTTPACSPPGSSEEDEATPTTIIT